MQLTEGNRSVSSPLPNQNPLFTTNLAFSTYYMPSLAEYLAPLPTPSSAAATEQNVYEWGNQWLMSTFTTTVAGMYWSRLTALLGPDSYVNGTIPAYNDKVNYTIPDTLPSNRQTMNPSWALYVVLGVQPVLISLIFIASFVLSYFSHLRYHRHPCRSANGDFKALRWGVVLGYAQEARGRTDRQDYDETRERTTDRVRFLRRWHPPEPSATASWRHHFMPSRFDTRKNTGYHKVDV